MKEVVPRTSFFTTIGKELKQRRIFTTESHDVADGYKQTKDKH